MPIFCQDYGQAPGCLGEADPEFRMDFNDVEKGAYINWCSACGPRARILSKAITRAYEKHGQEFTDRFSAAIDEAESKKVLQ